MYTYHGDYQQKVMAFFVGLLRNDPYLQTKQAQRVHPDHLSTLENPVYPCTTFYRVGRGSDPSFAELDNPILLIDVWSKRGKQELCDIYASKDSVSGRPVGIRSLITNKGFDIPEAIIQLVREIWVDDNLYESWSRTHHLQARFDITVSAKTLVVP